MMRALIWLLLLAALAIGVALFGRGPTGYVLWVLPPWRVELSFNLYVLLQLAVLAAAYLLLRGIVVVLDMPRAVGEYRRRRARAVTERAAATALRAFWEGRYALALRTAEKVVAVPLTPDPALPPQDACGIATLVALKSAHALHDGVRIERWATRAEALDAHWQTAHWMARMRIALDARDVVAARQALEHLGPGARRQIVALRLALRLAQGENDGRELLRLTRLLEKHGALTAEQARPLRLRAQIGLIDSFGDDPERLMQHWQAIEASERADSQVVHRAVRALTAAGACEESAQLVEEHLDVHWQPGLLGDYALCAGGDVLRRIAQSERWLHEHPRDADLLLALGRLCLRQQLWGKAQSYLEASLAVQETRAAHVELAQLLERLEKSALAGRHYRAAALL